MKVDDRPESCQVASVLSKTFRLGDNSQFLAERYAVAALLGVTTIIKPDETGVAKVRRPLPAGRRRTASTEIPHEATRAREVYRPCKQLACERGIRSNPEVHGLAFAVKRGALRVSIEENGRDAWLGQTRERLVLWMESGLVFGAGVFGEIRQIPPLVGPRDPALGRLVLLLIACRL